MKSILLLFIFCCTTLILKAQDDKFSSLDLSFDYFSNTNTFGQFNQITKQPSYNPGISYITEDGIYLSAFSSFLENSDTNMNKITSEFSITTGYLWNIGEYFVVFPSYSHYLYSKDANSLKSNFTDNFSLDGSANIKKFSSGVTVNYLIGEDNQWFISPYFSYSIEFEDVFVKNSTLFIQPEINASFNNQSYYLNYFWDNYQNNSDFRDALRENDYLRNLFLYYKQQYPELTFQQLIALISLNSIEKEEKFNLSSIGLTIPVYYMIGDFSINASFSTYFLTNQPDYVEENIQTYFSIGLSYSFIFD